VRLGGDGQRERRRERVERVVARDAAQVEHLERTPSAVGRAGPAEKPLPMGAAEQRKHEIAPHVHVVDEDEELSKSGLPEILRQQLHVSPRKLSRRRRRQRRGAANQVPQFHQAPIDDGRGREGRAQKAPHHAVARPASGPRTERRRDEPQRKRRQPDQDGEQHQPRNDGRERCRREEPVDPIAEGRPQCIARPLEADERHQQPEHADNDRGGDERQRNRKDGGGCRERPAGELQRRPPPIEASGRSRLPQSGGFPEPRPSVHRGEEGADRAGAASRDEIDLHPRLVQGAKDAGMVGASRARTGQHDRRAEPSRVLPIRRVSGDHG